MASTYTTSLVLELMADGENDDTWGAKANANFTLLDKGLGLSNSVTITTANVTLTDAQAAYYVQACSGTLTAARALIVPTRKRAYAIQNGCAGAYNLTVRTSAGTGVVVAQGTTMIVWCDGTNVVAITPDFYAGIAWADDGGSADALTGAYSPAITKLFDGMMLRVRAANANATTTPTFSPDSLGGPDTIVKGAGSALAVGDIAGDGHELLLCYDLPNTQWILLNPYLDVGFSDPMTTRGDMIYRNASNETARLAIGAADTAPVSDGTDLAFVAILKQGLETIWVPAVAMYPRTTAGAATGTAESSTNKVMSQTLDFDTTTQEYAQFAVRFPKNWNEGTITFEPIWSAASGSGTVAWTLAGVALSNDDALDSAFGTAQSSSDTLIATGDVHVGPASSAITIGGTPAAGDWVAFQVSRDVGSDTLSADARLLGITIFFTVNAADDT